MITEAALGRAFRRCLDRENHVGKNAVEFGFFKQYTPPHRRYQRGRIPEARSNAKGPHAEIDVMVDCCDPKDASHLFFHDVLFFIE